MSDHCSHFSDCDLQDKFLFKNPFQATFEDLKEVAVCLLTPQKLLI